MRLLGLAEQVWKFHQKAILLLASLLVLNLLLYVSISQWLVPEVISQETLFLQKQAEMRAILHKQGGAKTPQQLFVLASQDVSKFRQSVPEYRDFTGLIEELLVLANKARLNITRVSYASEELKQSPLLKFKLSFNVTGEYEQVKRFIYSLEQSTRLLVIKQISLQETAEEGVNLLLNLETFFRAEGEES